MRRRFLAAGALIAITAVSIFVWSGGKISAEEPRLWSGEIGINSVLDYPDQVVDTLHNFCRPGTMQTRYVSDFQRLTGPFIAYTAGTYEYGGAEYPSNCVYNNQFGYFSDALWATDKLDESARISMPTETSLIPVPSSNVVVTTKLLSVGLSRSYSINYNFRPEVVAKLGVTTRGSGTSQVHEKTYFIDETKLSTPLSYADGTPIAVDAVSGFSENGRYGVVLVYRKGYALIDLQKKVVTPFAINRSTTTAGIKFAVTNNGDYVATTQGANVMLYDLFSCTAYLAGTLPQVAFDSMPTGCQGRDLTPIVRTMCSIRQFSNRTRFNYYGTQLSLDPQCNAVDGTFSLQRFLLSPTTIDTTVYNPRGYLALGDSYSSGEGDTEGGEWYEPGTDEHGSVETFAGRNLCHVSRRSYPYLIAKQLNYLSGMPTDPVTPPDDGLFHSVACSGAHIHNIIGSIGEKHDDGSSDEFAITDNQYRYDAESVLKQFTPGNERQLGYLQGRERSDSAPRPSINPEIITLGIGGNDAGFGDFLAACMLPGTCEFSDQGSLKQQQFMLRLAHNKDRLVKAYKATKQAAPDTRVYVHGYPEFLQQSGGDCGVNVLLNAQERFFAVEAIRYMNDIVEAAAAEAGVYYVDLEDMLSGVNLCSGLDNPDLAFNGATAGNDLDPLDGHWIQDSFAFRSGACIGECVGSETYHPNSFGHERYSATILNKTANLTVPMPTPTPQLIPIPNESYFGIDLSNLIWLIDNPDGKGYVPYKSPASYIFNTITQKLMISANNLMPNTEAQLVLQSDPVVIGTYQIGPDGVLNVPIDIPLDISSGYHELHLYAVLASGVRVDLYESLIIGAAEGDFDGDGVLNELDSCKSIVNAGIDDDGDGIDDACDSVVIVIPPVDDPTDDPPIDDPVDDPEDPPSDDVSNGKSLEVLRRVFTRLLQANTPGLIDKNNCANSENLHPIICTVLIAEN